MPVDQDDQIFPWLAGILKQPSPALGRAAKRPQQLPQVSRVLQWHSHLVHSKELPQPGEEGHRDFALTFHCNAFRYLHGAPNPSAVSILERPHCTLRQLPAVANAIQRR